MPAPAARRRRRLALAERVVEEAEEGDPQQVGQPAPQFGVEQVEVAAVVEEGERRQRDQRRRRQHRAEREGERARRGSSPAPGRRRAAPAPPPARPAARPRSPAGSRPSTRSVGPAVQQVRQQPVGAALDAEAALGAEQREDQSPARRRSGRRRRRWRGRCRWKKEIEDGSAVEVSTPTAGVRVAVIPLISADFELAGGRALRPGPCPPAGCGRRSPRRARRSCRWRARRGGRGRLRAGCRRAPAAARARSPSAVSVSGLRRDVGEAGLGEVAGEAAEVDRLAHDPDADQLRPGRPERVLDRAGDVARQAAEGDDRDPLARAAGRGPAPGRRGRRTRSARPSSPLSSSARERASWRLPMRLCSRSLRVLVSASPPNSAPIRIPIASARKTAISEVAW